MKWHTVLLGLLVLFISSLDAKADWEFYEETNVKGMINGIIQKDSIIQMQSESIYQVSELTLQLVLELAPEALVLHDGERFKVIIDGFDEPLICRKLNSPRLSVANTTRSAKSATSPKANDHSDISLEKLMSETQQRRMGIHKLTKQEQERLRTYLIRLYLLGVENGKKETPTEISRKSVSPAASSVIESQIDGDFEGWEGETIVKLMNGQIWQQAEYHYHYHYAFMPKVLIYKSGIGYKMKVDGVDKSISVTQLR